MKFLLLIGILAVAYLLWRGSHRPPRGDAGPAPREPASPQDMVRCPVCSVHLPRADALPAPGGQLFYCSAEHRRAAGH